jgi:hypothetical protein
LRHWVIGALVSFLAAALYALTLAPDISWAHDGQDGGDLITAVMTGGVPHPPGYPTYLLLAAPLTNLPVANPAWRLNLFSAVCAASAVGLVTLTVLRLSERLGYQRREVVGAVAGLSLAFSRGLWSQATIAEVYALGAFFAALLVFLACPVQHTPDCAWAFTFGAILGVALGANLMLCLAGLLALRTLGCQWKMWGWAAWGLALGLCVFLTLPLRAQNHPPVNWGNASTPDGFWWLVSAQLYTGYVFALPLNLLGLKLLAWASIVVRQFTPIGVLVSGVGILRLWKFDKRLTGVTLVMYVGWSVFAIGYSTTDSYVHLVPAWVLMAIWLGMGLVELAHRVGRSVPPVLRWGAAFALPLTLLAINWPAMEARLDQAATDFGRMVMTGAPARAILVTSTDAHTFTLWYHQYVLRQRPDVLIVDRDLLDLSWYRATLMHASGLELELHDPLAEFADLKRPMCQVSQTALECQ